MSATGFNYRCPHCGGGFYSLAYRGRCPYCLARLSDREAKRAARMAQEPPPPEYDRLAWGQRRKRKKGPAKQKSLRVQIYERDGYRCLHCGESRPHLLTLDHIIPRSKGGPNTLENLQTLCRDCNGRKGDSMPVIG